MWPPLGVGPTNRVRTFERRRRTKPQRTESPRSGRALNFYQQRFEGAGVPGESSHFSKLSPAVG